MEHFEERFVVKREIQLHLLTEAAESRSSNVGSWVDCSTPYGPRYGTT